MKSRRAILFLICLMSVFLTAPVGVNAASKAQSKYTQIPASASLKVRNKVLRSAVKVIDEKTGSYGSGSYISLDNEFVVLTAAHVIEGVDKILVKNGYEVVSGEVIFQDDVNDIAFLKVQQMKTREPLKYKISSAANVAGNPVLYAGYPNAHDLLLFFGNIAGRYSNVLLIHSYAWMGASGSVVLDFDGKIVGVLVAIDVGGGGPRGMQLVEDVVWVSDINNVNINTVKESLKKKNKDKM